MCVLSREPAPASMAARLSMHRGGCAPHAPPQTFIHLGYAGFSLIGPCQIEYGVILKMFKVFDWCVRRPSKVFQLAEEEEKEERRRRRWRPPQRRHGQPSPPQREGTTTNVSSFSDNLLLWNQSPSSMSFSHKGLGLPKVEKSTQKRTQKNYHTQKSTQKRRCTFLRTQKSSSK